MATFNSNRIIPVDSIAAGSFDSTALTQGSLFRILSKVRNDNSPVQFYTHDTISQSLLLPIIITSLGADLFLFFLICFAGLAS